MDIKIIIIALAVLGLLGVVFAMQSGSIGSPNVEQGPSAPVVREIQFPEEIVADGVQVDGLVRFSDADGDITSVRFEVVEATAFSPFSINLGNDAMGIRSGEVSFGISTFFEQSITLRVTIFDAMGLASEPFDFTFNAAGEF